MVQMARVASMGRTNARDAGQAAAAAGGGGGERPDLTLFTTKSPSSFFSRVNQVEGERGRRAGWARSESRRVAEAYQRAFLLCPRSQIDDLDVLQLTERVPSRVSHRSPAAAGKSRYPAPEPLTRAPRCAERGSGTLLGPGRTSLQSRLSDAAELTRCRPTHASKSGN